MVKRLENVKGGTSVDLNHVSSYGIMDFAVWHNLSPDH